MNLKDCYAAMDSNYDEVIGRLRSEKIVKKFVLKFLDDTSFDLLCTSIEDENGEEAFRAAHTIKGVCQNLGFSGLYESSHEMAELLRSGWNPEAVNMLPRVKEEYSKTVAAIEALKSESEDA